MGPGATHIYKSGHCAACRLLSILLEFLSRLPLIMSPIIILPPVRIPPLASRSRTRNSAICVVCVNARQWDIVHDMCRLCAMKKAEEAAQRRARLVARAEDEERALTIRIPPRIRHICALCRTDYLLPLAGDQSDRCRPYQKSEKCSSCKKIKKKKRFRKENG